MCILEVVQNVFFNLENEWIKKAKRYVAFYNFNHVDEEPINFSALVREALRETLKDRLNISEILENTTLRSSYRVCRVGLAEEDIKDLENEKQKFVLTAIARTDVYDALGRPVYKPFFVNLFVPVSPEELRGGPSSFIPSPRTVEDAEVEAVHIEKG